MNPTTLGGSLYCRSSACLRVTKGEIRKLIYCRKRLLLLERRICLLQIGARGFDIGARSLLGERIRRKGLHLRPRLLELLAALRGRGTSRYESDETCTDN